MSDIVFPKNWTKLNEHDQKEWILEHYMPKQKIPEPFFVKDDQLVKGYLKFDSGNKVKLGKKDARLKRKNPNIVREFQEWVGRWLFTVFHDKTAPQIKYFGISNPSLDKWTAQELSPYILSKINGIIMKIKWKYGLFKGNKGKKRNKK